MAADLNGRSLWELRPKVRGNPRKGIGNVLKDVERTERIAGAGRLLLLIDRDRVAEHLGLPNSVADDVIVAAIAQRSGSSDRLDVHFLYQNMEDLLRAAADCSPGQRAPSAKEHNARDVLLNRLAFGERGRRDCVRQRQAGLDGLTRDLARLSA